MSEAGRELDALIAERVMGWKLFAGEPGYGRPPSKPLSLVLDTIPRYSTDIAVAWLVVEVLRGRNLHLQMNDTMSAYRARFFTVESTAQWDRESADGAFYQFADTAPLAICRAALAALGVPS